jgi:hypothetical protein
MALLGSLVASAFGMLSVALVLAAVTLPAAMLTYIHDHRVWRGDPTSVVGIALLLSLVLGVAVGVLQRYFAAPALLLNPAFGLPPITTILELGVLLPIVAFIAVLIAPVVVTMRPAFRHPIDALVTCTLSGAAFSLGLSIVVEIGAFTQVSYGEPARVAFIALTLGFLQPIIFGTAAAESVMAMRGAHANTAAGLVKGVLLVVVYEIGTTLLTPYGSRGLVLNFVLATVVAAAGLTATRADLHAVLLAEAQQAVTGNEPLLRAPDTDCICGQCHAAIPSGAAFCQACGTATAALAHGGPAKTAATT